jgi:hypothetical protein
MSDSGTVDLLRETETAVCTVFCRWLSPATVAPGSVTAI